jgi:hypothetical protein
VPKVQSWRGRIGAIISALEQTEATVLDRSDVEELFQLQRRAALRLMERVGPTEQAGEWRIDRARLLEWLRKLGAHERDEDERSRKVRRPRSRRNWRTASSGPSSVSWAGTTRPPGQSRRRCFRLA